MIHRPRPGEAEARSAGLRLPPGPTAAPTLREGRRSTRLISGSPLRQANRPIWRLPATDRRPIVPELRRHSVACHFVPRRSARTENRRIQSRDRKLKRYGSCQSPTSCASIDRKRPMRGTTATTILLGVGPCQTRKLPTSTQPVAARYPPSPEREGCPPSALLLDRPLGRRPMNGTGGMTAAGSISIRFWLRGGAN